MPTTPFASGILDVFTRVPDPRARRGVRHRFPLILALAVAGVCAGARSFTAIAEWVHDAPATVLERVGATGPLPSESTIRRTLGRVDATVLDRLIGAWMWLRTSVVDGRRVIAVDGKTLRGAKDAAGDLTHLLAALDHTTGTVLGQDEVGAKTNEIPKLTDLLDPLDLTDVVVTADALHCQRATAEYIVVRGGHYVFTVKNNQPSLRNRLKALPWTSIPVSSSVAGRGHGRRERRTIKATEVAAGLGFPHATQVLQVRRTVTRRTRRSVEVVYVICSLPMTEADPDHVTAWIQGHWGIENRLHWVRDVVFDEDRSTVRTGAAPQVMATLRNTVISILRLAGNTNIAAAIRHHSRNPHRPVDLLQAL
ncbi:ISAs1 family transposase [Rhodococcus marinonascens]|uniref:ISAs1 family transposase n=1 Tax=Rhodococcus marinonascens TaxID=38311 RepID=UPI0009321F50|nr:ISAs1 family transposase [Rhodococcus marinonascens]